MNIKEKAMIMHLIRIAELLEEYGNTMGSKHMEVLKRNII